MRTIERFQRHAAAPQPLPIGFLLVLILLCGIGCTTRAEPQPKLTEEPKPKEELKITEEPEPEKAPEQYFSSLRSWEDFLHLSEEELTASMPAGPDTAVTSGDQRVLVYQLEPNKVARFFILQRDELTEDRLIFYFKKKEDAQALYQRAADHFGDLHGEPTLEHADGTMWNLYPETATDSLREVIEAVRKKGSLSAESLTLAALFAAASEAQQQHLTGLLQRHRSARVFMGAHLLGGVYTLTVVRAAGDHALWSAQGERISLGAL